jgi:hypothetical protein
VASLEGNNISVFYYLAVVVFFSYLTDFSYFSVKFVFEISRIIRTGQKSRAITALPYLVMYPNRLSTLHRNSNIHPLSA